MKMCLCRYKVAMQDDVPRIFESVFHCTLEVTDSMVHGNIFLLLFMEVEMSKIYKVGQISFHLLSR